MPNLYDVVMIAYCGLVWDIVRSVDYDEAKAVAKRFRTRQAEKYGCEVSKLSNHEWEIITPDDAFMIRDSEGFLKIRKAK